MMQLIQSGGVQVIRKPQIVYLDFDGEQTSYNGEQLNIEHVTVEDSDLTEERIASITARLNAEYAEQNVIFVTERPGNEEFSTVFVGQTDAFEEYGSFLGLAETIDKENQIKNDNAFVLADATWSNEQVISVISHEIGHIVLGEEHTILSDSIADYAASSNIDITINSNFSHTYKITNSTNRNTLEVIQDAFYATVYVPFGQTVEITVSWDRAVQKVNCDGYISVHFSNKSTNDILPNGAKWYITATYYDDVTITVMPAVFGLGDYPGAARYWIYQCEFTLTVKYINISGSPDLKSYAPSGWDGPIVVSTVTDTNRNSSTITTADKIYVDFAFVNAGDADAGAFYISVSLDDSVIYEVKFEYGLASKFYHTIKDFDLLKYVEGPLSVGTHTIKFVVDSKNDIKESDETNNTFEKTFTVTAAAVKQPDLVVSAISVSNATITAEQSVTLTFTVKNQGDAAAGASAAYIYAGTTLLDTITVDGLAAGESLSFTHTISGTTLGVGEHSLWVKADGVADELNKNNNESTKVMVNVTGGGSGGNSGVMIYSSDTLVSSGTAISGAMLSGDGNDMMFIYSGGTATETIINSGGTLEVHSGGTANSTTINSGGNHYVVAGGLAIATTINSEGQQDVYSGGMANSTTIETEALQDVYWEGVAIGTIISSGGVQEVNFDGIASGTIIYHSGLQDVYRSGVAVDTTINSGGIQAVNFDGIAGNTIIHSEGVQVVYSSGVAVDTIINSGGIQAVEFNGIAGNTIIHNGGLQDVYSRGVAVDTIINSGGIQTVNFDGAANRTTVNSGGWQDVSEKGVLNSTTVNSGGTQTVSSGCATNHTLVHSGGSMAVSAGAVIGGTTLLGGTLVISEDVTAAAGAKITFAMNERKTADSYIINNIGLIAGMSYSITVNAGQAAGSYLLAAGATGFSQSISIGDGSVNYGTLTVNGSALNYGGQEYSLVNSDGTLALNIAGGASVLSSLNTDLLDNGYSQIVAWDSTQGKVGYVATNGQAGPPWTGIWEWSGSDISMWKVVGVGRFSADVEHDGILLYNGNGNTFAAWTDLGRGDYGYVSLCHVDGNFQTLALADFDNNGLDDVIIYDEKGSFGIVSDAASYHDVWHVENAATNVQKVIGAGYFGNADGKSDILVKKTDENAYFLWHNQDSTFNTWNWSQTYIGSLDNDWEVAAVGDFQGDGIDDIIMWQKSTGYMYAWEDGKSSNQRWVGALDSSDWEVAAVGDYNGDGKEDLLLRELVSGWGGVGYWAGANASNWTDLNARIETDMESKFAVIA